MRLGSTRLAHDLGTRMKGVQETVWRILDFQKMIGTNGDNLSWAMYKFIEPIREISTMGTQSASTNLISLWFGAGILHGLIKFLERVKGRQTSRLTNFSPLLFGTGTNTMGLGKGQ